MAITVGSPGVGWDRNQKVLSPNDANFHVVASGFSAKQFPYYVKGGDRFGKKRLAMTGGLAGEDCFAEKCLQ